jgi:hypothetical protein
MHFNIPLLSPLSSVQFGNRTSDLTHQHSNIVLSAVTIAEIQLSHDTDIGDTFVAAH